MAIVTGASRGIGLDIAKKLAKKGILVIGTATTPLGVQKINNYLKNYEGQGLILNLHDSINIKEKINKIYKNFNNIDILVNNAGIKCDKLLINMTTKNWIDVLNVNLTGIFHLSKLIVPSMIKNRQGRIITIGSIVGHIGNYGQTNYAATKSGLIGFHKSLALELASYGITVNIIAPGLIKTDMTDALNYKKYKKYIERIPMKRFGEVNDISEAVLFLVSNKASYITGQTLHINGGMYMC
ncbi:3-oxoacyl-[acyl-carrier-protein] reductase [Buchnera aphidicola (Pemphigus obesinymphae)]|uniref:3-oxoacyl-[acyl-carrier-protein] reductase n=1 Tax=Buchnera aphidicola TaxID=9 RepID=UPI0022375FF6|nr:3-oxoacyl-[acyl-carrier-protein] reductase [Buchnera aphidicola]MCW5196604.1 3-oxoacyl-[acyl-carrier-protein] reductase [Buchnera aphidicola (Pemphigus obesinymphae)]